MKPIKWILLILIALLTLGLPAPADALGEPVFSHQAEKSLNATAISAPGMDPAIVLT